VIAEVAGVGLEVGTAPAWLAPFARDVPARISIEVLERAGVAGPSELRVARRGAHCTYETRSCAGELDLGTGRAMLRLAPGARSLEGFLRFVVGGWLVEREAGLLLHAAGLSRNGRGYVFLGESGAGKSTVARLGEEGGARVLGDEIVAVTSGEGGARLHGTPFGSRERPRCAPGAAPLAALCALQKAEEAAFRPEPAGSRARWLLAHAVAAPECVRGDALLAVAERVARACPGGVLAFRRDAGFWGVLPG
jgi:hypothetical protein